MRVYSNISHATRTRVRQRSPWMPAALPDFDSTAFRSALGRFATGVTVVTAMGADGQPVGLTVSSFNSVSLSPPLVLWSLSLTSGSLPVLEAAGHYAVNVLAADQIDVARRFATRGHPAERFAHVTWRPGRHGAPLIDGCTAWFECYNRSRYREGDHCIFVGEVEHCRHTDAMPLVFHAGGFDLTPQRPRKIP
ncbi:flavin reductase (DIM6/NTAB) family NADH-FMN oxidoreductase RutF [Pigmentiphaga kullae]|uniref:Flavin reductase (DIM6/NTAB) family NADH-FMN oxidoreductase RutF n=2 Tax=Pigmentiphaga kullae TaxID=151784 RepID=A0A4Q7N7N6_9BURK|nr:flavin reductase (DIM6/NTAB) family NADH-FMN oxidoreductase RutF [Pigmentiphaga kullae]